MEQQAKRVPYGVSDFKSVIEQNQYYVDKTMFLPELEKQPNNLFFIRPRRFGKRRCTVSLCSSRDGNWRGWRKCKARCRPIFQLCIDSFYWTAIITYL